MKSPIISTTANSISSGGTISGDVTISGDLTVNGDGSGTYDEIISGGLHIQQSSSGGTANTSADDLVIESSGDTGMSILSGTSSNGFIFFADSGDDNIAGFDYDHQLNKLNILVNAATRMAIDSSGLVGIGGTPTEQFHIHQGADDQGLKITGYDDRNDKHAEFSISSGGDFNITASGHVQINGGGNLYLYDYVLVQDRVTKTGAGTLQFGGTYDVDMHFLGTGDAVVMAIDNGNKNVVIGNTAGVSAGSVNAPFQVLGNSGATTHTTFGRWSADDTPSVLNFIKSRNASIAGNTVVADNDGLGIINFRGNDGTDNEIIGAQIKARVNGSPGSNNIPTELVFSTAKDGSSSPSETMRINSDGELHSRPVIYNTGTATQSGTTVTGSGTTFSNAAHVGAEFVWADGVSVGLITACASTTSITVTESRTVGSASSYNIHAYGINTKTKFVGINHDNPSYLLHVKAGGHYTYASGVLARFEDPTYGSYTINNQGGQLTLASSTHMVLGFATANSFRVKNAASTVRFLVDDDSRISLGNNDGGGNNNTIFGKLAGNAITSGGVRNTIIGEYAGTLTDSNDDNVFVGYYAGATADDATTTAQQNTYVGTEAGRYIDDGRFNVGIGYQSVYGASTGNDAQYSVGVGHKALFAITDGDYNVAVGASAGAALTTGAENTLLGHQAGASLNTQARNIMIGYQTGFNIQGSAADDNVFVGYFAGGNGEADDDTSNTATDNVAIGSYSMGDNQGNTAPHFTASSNVAVGYKSLKEISSGASNVAIGLNAGAESDVEDDNVFIGKDSASLMKGQQNVAVGKDALKGASFTDATCHVTSGNDAIPHDSNANILAGMGVKGTGIPAGAYIQNKDSNTQFTLNSGFTPTDGDGSEITLTFYSRVSQTIAIGYDALTSSKNGTYNNAIGYLAGTALTTGSRNVMYGTQSGERITTASENVLIGNSTGAGLTTSGNNTYVGHAVATNASSTGHSNTFVGSAVASGGAMTGDYNVGMGRNALLALTSGSNNIAIGFQSGDAITTDQNVVVIGKDAYSLQDTANDAEGSSGHGSGNIAIGYQAMTSFNEADFLRNTAVGFQSMSAGTTDVAQDNTALGYRALQLVTTGDGNVAIGSYSLKTNTVGQYNTAIGYKALFAINEDDNDGSVAIGYDALRSKVGTGGSQYDATSIAVGFQAGTAENTGQRNTYIGFQAGLALKGASNDNIIIGYEAADETNTRVSLRSIFIGNNAGGGTWGDTNEDNVAIGYNSMDGALADSKYNVAIGSSTLGALTSGDTNTAVGHGAGAVISTGGNNTVIGAGAGDLIQNGVRNVAVGSDAGNILVAGENNVIIGHNADASGSSASNQIAIGYNVAAEGNNQTVIGCGSIWKMFSAEVTCDLGGTDENDPAHATPIGKIPHNACVVKAAVVMKTKNGTSGKDDHSLKLVLSSSSSGTDNTALADVQELVGAGMTHSWNGAAATSQAADIDCSNNTGQDGTAYVSMALPNSRGSDDPVTQLASLDMRDGDRYIYLAFANGSHTDGDTNPASAPVCQVYVEYVGLQL